MPGVQADAGHENTKTGKGEGDVRSQNRVRVNYVKGQAWSPEMLSAHRRTFGTHDADGGIDQVARDDDGLRFANSARTQSDEQVRYDLTKMKAAVLMML